MANWFVRPRPNPQALQRLICFPFAGGATSTYRTWHHLLPPTVELNAVALPGREMRMREPPFVAFDALCDTLTEAIRPLLDRPFSLFGHSLGSMVAFEVTRRLRRFGHRQPKNLFISGCGAPQFPHRDPPIHALPDTEFKKELARYNGTPKEILENHELMNLILPTLRADFSVFESYDYVEDRKLSCPVTVFGGLSDRVTRESLEGWASHTDGSFVLRMFPGDHFFITSQQHSLVEMIARELVKP